MIKYIELLERGDKMNNYFLVPITSKNIKMNGISFKEILKRMDEELFNREEERLELTYKLKEDVEEIHKCNEETHKLYHKKGIPEKIIILSDDFETTELVTNTEVECDDGYLDVFRADMKESAEVLLHTDYYEQIDKFVEASKKGKEKKI